MASKYQIGDIVEAIPDDGGWFRKFHLTPGKTYEVLGVVRGDVRREDFLVTVDNDRGERTGLHESWFRYPAPSASSTG